MLTAGSKITSGSIRDKAVRVRRLECISVWGIAPTACTGSSNTAESTVAVITAAKEPGTLAPSLAGQRIIRTITNSPIASEYQLGVTPLCTIEATRSSALFPVRVTPNKLPTCPSAMMMAIPEVKPEITGEGKKYTRFPKWKSPASISIMPANKDAANKVSNP